MNGVCPSNEVCPECGIDLDLDECECCDDEDYCPECGDLWEDCECEYDEDEDDE